MSRWKWWNRIWRTVFCCRTCRWRWRRCLAISGLSIAIRDRITSRLQGDFEILNSVCSTTLSWESSNVWKWTTGIHSIGRRRRRSTRLWAFPRRKEWMSFRSRKWEGSCLNGRRMERSSSRRIQLESMDRRQRLRRDRRKRTERLERRMTRAPNRPLWLRMEQIVRRRKRRERRRKRRKTTNVDKLCAFFGIKGVERLFFFCSFWRWWLFLGWGTKRLGWNSEADTPICTSLRRLATCF